jgi:hypothetical protein
MIFLFDKKTEVLDTIFLHKTKSLLSWSKKFLVSKNKRVNQPVEPILLNFKMNGDIQFFSEGNIS